MPRGKLAKIITKKIRKGAAKELTDLGEPASTAGTPRVQGQGTTGGIRESAQTAFTQTSKGKTLTKKIKELARLRLKASGLSKEKRKEFLFKNKDRMDGLQASITDMKRRGIDKKMGGGKVMKYKKGGMVYMKNGGVVKASKSGDDLVSSCYD